MGNETLVTILVGKKDQTMWLQFEAGLFNLKSWDKIVASLPHVLDSIASPLQTFIAYRTTGKNVGPLGLSEHNDANPMKFTEWRPVEAACPSECKNLNKNTR